jgi:hypothetical protein
MPENFGEVAPAPPENEKIAAMRIASEPLLNLQGQSPHATAHVGMTGRDPDPAASRNRNQDRSAFNVAVINADGACIPIRIWASFIRTTITAGTISFGGGVDDAAGGGEALLSTITRANPGALTARRASRRHLYTRLVQTSARRATSAITAPGSPIAAKILSRSSSLQRRRRSSPVINVIRPMLCS